MRLCLIQSDNSQFRLIYQRAETFGDSFELGTTTFKRLHQRCSNTPTEAMDQRSTHGHVSDGTQDGPVRRVITPTMRRPHEHDHLCIRADISVMILLTSQDQSLKRVSYNFEI